jgi:hypothetical protein
MFPHTGQGPQVRVSVNTPLVNIQTHPSARIHVPMLTPVCRPGHASDMALDRWLELNHAFGTEHNT